MTFSRSPTIHALGLAAIASVLRPGGLLSLLAANRSAAVLGRVLAGRLDAAEIVLDGGTTGTTDRTVRRFDLAELVAFVEAAGMSVLGVHGDRVFSDLVPGAVLDNEPHAREILQRLEEKVVAAAGLPGDGHPAPPARPAAGGRPHLTRVHGAGCVHGSGCVHGGGNEPS